MDIYIKFENLQDLVEVYSTGIINGIDIDYPKQSQNFDLKSQIKAISKDTELPIFIPNDSDEFQQIISESINLSKISKNIIIKLPISEYSIKAAQVLEHRQVSTCISSISSLSQAIIAAKAKVSKIIVSELSIQNHLTRYQLLNKICNTFDIYEFRTKIGIEEVTSREQLEKSFETGIDFISISTQLFWEMFQNNDL